METTNLLLSLQNGTEEFTIPNSLNRSTVVYFMRASNCAQCNRHTRELEKLLPELESRNLDVIIIVPEDAAAANKVRQRNNLTIQVMAGNGNAHALAGLDKKFIGIIQQSGTVVVDRAGTILYKRIATNPEESFKVKEFEDYLASLSLAS
jgi:peroxiredoxin